MSYATVAELKNRIGKSIFSEIYPSGFEGESPAESDLEAAAAETNGVLGVRYHIPVTGEESLRLLKDWTLTLTEEKAAARPAGSMIAEKIKDRVAQVRKYFEMILENKFLLPNALENGVSGGGLTLFQADESVFGREKMRRF